MKNFSRIAIASAMLAISVGAVAQTQLKVTTGSATGTYSRMFKELQGVCKDQILQIEMPSKGSVENADRLLGNEANAAFIQTDVLFARARNEDLSGVKTLVSLFPEEVHVIAPTVSPLKTGGVLGVGAKPLTFNSVNDLAGQTIVAWGGSVVTATFIRLQSEIPFNVVEVADFKTAKTAIDSGQAAAILMVGGQPMSDVQTLNNAYKLLPFPDATVGKLKSVYVPAKVTYSSMGQGGSGIQTVATEALFVTRAYKTEKYVNALSTLRSCFVANLPDLQETIGMHKKWAAVHAENTGKWPYYELPATPVKISSKK